MNDIATTQRAGSAKVQGDLWNARARDYAEILEGFFRPLYESGLARPEVSQAESMLDIGCGPGLRGEGLFAEDPGRRRGRCYTDLHRDCP